MDYQIGLCTLRNLLPKEAYSDFDTYEARLLENLRYETQHGSTEQIRATRSEILEQLNQLSRNYGTLSFNDLCRSSHESTTDNLSLATPNEAIYSKRNQLSQHKKNLNQVLERAAAAIYGSNATLAIQNEIQHEMSSIEQLQNSIREELISKRSNLKNFPKKYNEFIGRKTSKDNIFSALSDSENYHILAIDGLGGIGKTALAREIVELSLDANIFYSVAWDSAKPEEFTGTDIQPQFTADIDFDNLLDSIGNQLGYWEISQQKSTEKKRELVQDILNSERYLVVIDNLETVKGYRNLLNNLSGMFTRSKAILTTRKKVNDVFYVYSFSLRGLEQPESIEFLKSFASSRGETGDIIRLADEEKLIRIHQYTGGLPLAMQLVVGQATRSSKLEIILERLNNVNFHQVEKPESDEDVYNKFYKFIYWDSWHQLSEQARKVLTRIGSFSLSKGADFEELEFTTRLRETELDNAVGELIEHSLIYLTIKSENSSFSLHPLTYRFVQDELVRG
jgi:hypothetical protein